MPADEIEFQENFKAVQLSECLAHESCRMPYIRGHDDKFLLINLVQIMDLCILQKKLHFDKILSFLHEFLQTVHLLFIES